MEKIYAKGIYFKAGKFGKRVSINVEQFTAFLNENKNEKGYVNLNINPRKEVSDKGETDYMTVDTWQPNESKSDLPFN